jgi:hypothetical protein
VHWNVKYILDGKKIRHQKLAKKVFKKSNDIIKKMSCNTKKKYIYINISREKIQIKLQKNLKYNSVEWIIKMKEASWPQTNIGKKMLSLSPGIEPGSPA